MQGKVLHLLVVPMLKAMEDQDARPVEAFPQNREFEAQWRDVVRLSFSPALLGEVGQSNLVNRYVTRFVKRATGKKGTASISTCFERR